MNKRKRADSGTTRKPATDNKSKTSSNEAYTALLSSLQAKLTLAERVAFEVWELTGKTEDLTNWLQAQNQLRITASLRSKVPAEEVGSEQ
jgi:hypothetical protein